MTKMYTTIEELYAHTTNDTLADFIWEVSHEMAWRDLDGYEFATIYGTFMAYIMSWFSNGKEGNREKIVEKCRRDTSMVSSFIEAIGKAEREIGFVEVADCINNLMHVLHLEEPSLRKNGTEMYSQSILPSLGEWNCSVCVSPSYEGIILTGKDAVPEEWKTEMEKIASTYGCFVECNMSWMYSHLDNGDDYTYNRPEDIMVEIFGDSSEGVKKAAAEIGKLHFN